MRQLTGVLVAGYQEIEQATQDFESLVGLVRDKQFSIEGVVLVRHARDAVPRVRQTGDNLGRKGLGWGGGVGLAVGLFAPLVRPMKIRLSSGRTDGKRSD